MLNHFDGSQDIRLELGLNRAIHILVEQYNQSLHSLWFEVLVASGITQIICVVALIGQPSCNSVAVVVNLFYLATTVLTVLINVIIYGFAGNLYENSKKHLSNLQQQNVPKGLSRAAKKEFKMRKTFFKSCQVEKIKFGMSNFIEQTTPPIFQLFCIARIIDLLLLKK